MPSGTMYWSGSSCRCARQGIAPSRNPTLHPEVNPKTPAGPHLDDGRGRRRERHLRRHGRRPGLCGGAGELRRVLRRAQHPGKNTCADPALKSSESQARLPRQEEAPVLGSPRSTDSLLPLSWLAVALREPVCNVFYATQHSVPAPPPTGAGSALATMCLHEQVTC